MDATKGQAVVLEVKIPKPEVPVRELSELQLVLVGGGIGTVIVG
jgi:hypothetical protein